METGEPAIRVLSSRVDSETLASLVRKPFGNMVKFVADVRTGRLALGGELHADAEVLLLEAGSRQDDVWGGNYYPGRGETECIEFTALINIRPAQGNPGMELLDPELRHAVRSLVFERIGRGEPL